VQGRHRDFTAKEMIVTLQKSKQSVMEELLSRDSSTQLTTEDTSANNDQGDLGEKLQLVEHDSLQDSHSINSFIESN
jgi:hypothetical protein